MLHTFLMKSIMDLESLEDKVKMIGFEDKECSFECAYIKAIDDDNIHVVFNLPIYSDKWFLTVSDGNPDEIAKVIAHLEEVDKDKSANKNDVIRFDTEYLRIHGIIGVLLLDVKVSPVFEGFGSHVEYGKNKVYPLLVVFLSQKEYEIWKNDGHDKLMDYFDLHDKDLVSI